jgi:hypothetical protein
MLAEHGISVKITIIGELYKFLAISIWFKVTIYPDWV